jgi:hypothetical protein
MKDLNLKLKEYNHFKNNLKNGTNVYLWYIPEQKKYFVSIYWNKDFVLNKGFELIK